MKQKLAFALLTSIACSVVSAQNASEPSQPHGTKSRLSDQKPDPAHFQEIKKRLLESLDKRKTCVQASQNFDELIACQRQIHGAPPLGPQNGPAGALPPARPK